MPSETNEHMHTLHQAAKRKLGGCSCWQHRGSVLLLWRMTATFPAGKLSGLPQLLYLLSPGDWPPRNEQYWEKNLDKSSCSIMPAGHPDRLTAEGTNPLVVVLGDWVPQHCSQTAGRGKPPSGMLLILDTPSQMSLSNPPGMRGKGHLRTLSLCQGNRKILSSSPVWLKVEAERNWNGLLIFLWTAEHYHTPKATGLVKKMPDCSKESFTKMQTDSKVERNKCK